MIIKIEIECETGAELVGHLQIIETQIKQKFKKLNLKPDDLLPAMDFHHDNCYGSHNVEVIIEEGPELDHTGQAIR